MKILCVIDNLGSGGAQRQLVNIATGLKARGHGVELFTYYRHDHFRHHLDSADIPVHLHKKRSRYSVVAIIALRKLIVNNQYDGVLAFLDTPSIYAELACVGLPTRLIVGERSAAYSGERGMHRTIRSNLHRLANAVTTNSHAHRLWLSSKYPFLKSKMHTIWNGVDLEVFHPPTEKSYSGKKEMRILGVGRITRAKNLPNLAHALKAVRDRGVECTISWAGRQDSDKVYCASVLDAINEAGVQSEWEWLGERQDIPELMRSYDALILPSLWEGLPNVVCEALASGLPVLASRVADNEMLVQHGETGFLFDPASVDGISQAISSFARLNVQERSAMSACARCFAEQNLSQIKCAVEYESILQHPESKITTMDGSCTRNENDHGHDSLPLLRRPNSGENL